MEAVALRTATLRRSFKRIKPTYVGRGKLGGPISGSRQQLN